MREEIRAQLRALAEEGYRKFNASLIPGKEGILGIRLPALRAYAKELDAAHGWRKLLAVYGIPASPAEEPSAPPRFMEEDLLCGLLLARAKGDFDEIAAAIRAFAPRVDNWAVCDSTFMGMSAFRREPERAWSFLREFFEADTEYGIRIAAVSTLAHFVDKTYLVRAYAALEALSGQGRLPEDWYYARMAVAWGWSVCYAKFPAETRPMLDRIGDRFIRNKAIAKTCESFRVSAEEKQFLREYKKSKDREVRI